MYVYGGIKIIYDSLQIKLGVYKEWTETTGWKYEMIVRKDYLCRDFKEISYGSRTAKKYTESDIKPVYQIIGQNLLNSLIKKHTSCF